MFVPNPQCFEDDAFIDMCNYNGQNYDQMWIKSLKIKNLFSFADDKHLYLYKEQEPRIYHRPEHRSARGFLILPTSQFV